ncbi:MAG TPA: GNAT family N-acetyltransferase [Pyrinomonadaceae bacterium]|nr:GNAT family N-acetyltransferase [Pyrinomonadaceae bacterium]
MEFSQTPSPADVEVLPASPEQEPILANLLELYAHDFSEFAGLKLGADGRFGYKHLPSYWEEPDRHPFLIKVNGNLAGFAFVRRGSEMSGDAAVWDMAEFFIARGYRRMRVGTKAAHAVWRKFPGRWEVRVMRRNQKAGEFWARAIGEFLGAASDPFPFGGGGERWQVFSFESKLVMITETDRLRLRKLTPDDAEFVIRLLNEPSFIRNIGDRGVRTAEDARSYILNGPVASYEKYGFGLWLVETKDSGEPVGICGLLKRDALDDVDLGYALLPEYWSKGYALESASAVMAYAGDGLGLKRVVAIVDAGNRSSIRLLERMGFKYERMIKLPGDTTELKLFAREA